MQTTWNKMPQTAYPLGSAPNHPIKQNNVLADLAIEIHPHLRRTLSKFR